MGGIQQEQWLPGARLTIHRECLSEPEAALTASLTLPWCQERRTGIEEHSGYQATMCRVRVEHLTGPLAQVLDEVETASGERYNSLWVTLRRPPLSDPWHTEADPELGDQPVLAMFLSRLRICGQPTVAPQMRQNESTICVHWHAEQDRRSSTGRDGLRRACGTLPGMQKYSGIAVVAGILTGMAVLGSRRGSGAFRDEGMVDGFWGSQGAGVLLTTGSRILLMERSGSVEQSYTWGIPGGAVPVDDETGEPAPLLATALTELREEAGLRLSESEARRALRGSTVFRAPRGRFRYTTFIIGVPDSFRRRKVELNWESDDARWISEPELDDYTLHQGVRFTLDNAGAREIFWRKS